MEHEQVIDFIAGRRRQLKISQKELGEAIGVSANHISRIETHKQNPSFEIVVRICTVLNLDIVIRAKRGMLDREMKHSSFFMTTD